MNDLISRKEAIYAIVNTVSKVDDNKTLKDKYDGSAFRQHEILDIIESIPPAPQWIPVTEKLPEEDKDVLVTVYFMGLEQNSNRWGWNEHINPSYYVDIASYTDRDWISASDNYKVAIDRHKVIAWMPLPEPYKEKE